MLIRVTALALFLGAGAPAMAVSTCLPGTACVAGGPVAVKANAVGTSKFTARQAAASRAAPKSHGREIAFLSGLVVLALLGRRRRLLPEVVS
jgi:hypothetical protein